MLQFGIYLQPGKTQLMKGHLTRLIVVSLMTDHQL